MSGGLVALLDDVAALAKVAAASIDDVGAAAGRASAKAAGLVVDDAAVTPRYVQDLAAKRELPIIRRIATGSLKNKILFILPLALILSAFVPWILTPILMLGGTYLCFEGAEKIWEYISGEQHGHHGKAVAATKGPEHEDKMVQGAVRTDFILSAEIMVIALNEVLDEPFISRAVTLLIVAIGMTIVVYGAVALIVKGDDFGLYLASGESEVGQKVGRGLVKGMPIFMKVLSTVGVAAMLWVGGHIILVGLKDLGWTLPYDLVHDLEVAVHDGLGAVGGFGGWLVNTIASAIVGAIWGGIIAAVMHKVKPHEHDEAHEISTAH